MKRPEYSEIDLSIPEFGISEVVMLRWQHERDIVTNVVTSIAKHIVKVANGGEIQLEFEQDGVFSQRGDTFAYGRIGQYESDGEWVDAPYAGEIKINVVNYFATPVQREVKAASRDWLNPKR